MRQQLSGLILVATLLLNSSIAFAMDSDGVAASRGDADHRAWAELLSEFTEDGRVDYRGLAQQPQLLRETLEQLESVDPADFAAWPTPARMAFWINAYNAYTIRWILDHYPTAGILDTVSPWRRLLGAPFNEPFIPLGALAGVNSKRLLSLSTIEHQILRKKFPDPRIHFAIVCASKSCPKLRNEPYSAARLDRQLDENARDFMRDTTKNRYDAGRRRLVVSKIFKWFRADFAAGGGPPGYFALYGPPSATAALATAAGPPTVVFGAYDWSLNE
jgi:hypothetical protein